MEPRATPGGNIRLFSTDLDGTLLGYPAAAGRFCAAWHGVPPRRRPLLVYNTGRTSADTRALVAARDLPEPDYIIASVGTELHDSLYNCGADFRQQFATGWDRARVDEIVGAIAGIKPQPEVCAQPYKSSWFWIRAHHDEVTQLRARLAAAGLQAQVIYSCRYFLDVVPARAGKGPALAWLCRRLQIPLEHVLVAGDTANDAAMFLLPGIRGIVVRNALPELLAEVLGRAIYVAHTPMGDGVIEGLQHFGVIDAGAAPMGSTPAADQPPAN